MSTAMNKIDTAMFIFVAAWLGVRLGSLYGPIESEPTLQGLSLILKLSFYVLGLLVYLNFLHELFRDDGASIAKRLLPLLPLILIGASIVLIPTALTRQDGLGFAFGFVEQVWFSLLVVWPLLYVICQKGDREIVKPKDAPSMG